MLTLFVQIQYLPESDIFPGLEHLLLFSPGEISSASSFVVPPLIVSLYFEDDNENMSGMVPGLSLCADIRRWRTSLLHTSCRPGIGSSILALSPSAATTTADSFHDSQPEASETVSSKHIKQLNC